MSLETFEQQIRTITDRIAGKPLNKELEQFLNTEFPADGELFQQINATCHQAIKDGWMCQNEHGGIRFGRVIKPNDALGGYSVDVVHMKDIAGPHHRHPNGEIDMIMPINDTARFDDHGKGWLVYPPDSAHPPTVTDGEALVLYLLPDGAIEFTKR